MVIAQSLGEYGAASNRTLAGAVDAGLRMLSTVVDSARAADLTTWLAVGAALVIIWVVFFKR